MAFEEPLLGTSYQKENTRRSFIYRYRHAIVMSFFASILIVTVVGVLITDSEKQKPIPIPPSSRLPTGSYKIADTDVYVAGSDDPVIVLLPDIYGMSVEVKQIADFYAKGGFTAVVIDYFNGDPRTNASDPDWNRRHPANLSLALANGVIENIASRGYESIQAQGYCYGGRIGVSLSFNTSIRSSVNAHASSIVAGDAVLITQPIFFVMPAVDGFNSLAPLFNQTLVERGIPAAFKIYPNTTHGFAVSATSNPAQKALAMADSLKWFVEYANITKVAKAPK